MQTGFKIPNYLERERERTREGAKEKEGEKERETMRKRARKKKGERGRRTLTLRDGEKEREGPFSRVSVAVGGLTHTREGPCGGWLAPRAPREMLSEGTYRSISLIQLRTPLGPYRRPLCRVLTESQGGGYLLMGEVPPEG